MAIPRNSSSRRDSVVNSFRFNVLEKFKCHSSLTPYAFCPYAFMSSWPRCWLPCVHTLAFHAIIAAALAGLQLTLLLILLLG